MSSLYELNQQLYELWRDKDEIDEDAFNDTWEALALERHQKIDATLSYIKCLKAWAESCKTEAKSLTERANSYLNKAENITVGLCRQLSEREQFANSRHEIKWRQSTSVDVTCQASELPAPFRRVSYSEDKRAIKEALSEGASIPGCSLRKEIRLSIK